MKAIALFSSTIAIGLAALVIAGCQPSEAAPQANEPVKSFSTSDSNSSASSATTNAPAENSAPSEKSTGMSPAEINAKAGATEPGQKSKVSEPKAGEEVAVVTTKFGDIVFKFRKDKAPKTVEAFIKLANKKFYDGTTFHRVIPNFMIQGGDPNTKPGATSGPPGTGGPGYNLKAEFNDMHHAPGVVSMARSSDPDSAGSQFFICVADADSLDNQYTAFGQVLIGQDVADKIVASPRDGNDMPNERVEMKVKIVKWPIKK